MSEIISLELDHLEMYKKPFVDSFTLKRSSNRARLGTPKPLSLKTIVTHQPGTRWGVKRGCHTSGLRLFNLFFLRADTCTRLLIHMHNLCNNKNLLHIHYTYHHNILYTYT